MGKYRISLQKGGLGGYWCVKKRYWPFALVKYSIYVYGDDKAYFLAQQACTRLLAQEGQTNE